MLKKARKIANGKDNANLVLGAFVDTLVVLPDDLVQVIAKVGYCTYMLVETHCLLMELTKMVVLPGLLPCY